MVTVLRIQLIRPEQPGVMIFTEPQHVPKYVHGLVIVACVSGHFIYIYSSLTDGTKKMVIKVMVFSR